MTFVVGLVAAPVIYGAISGQQVQQAMSDNILLMAVAGVLVGFGSVLGSGCTSGHGVCGMARISGRSFAATACFMAVAIATVFITRHLI